LNFSLSDEDEENSETSSNHINESVISDTETINSEIENTKELKPNKDGNYILKYKIINGGLFNKNYMMIFNNLKKKYKFQKFSLKKYKDNLNIIILDKDLEIIKKLKEYDFKKLYPKLKEIEIQKVF
jgi:hypothetical protein